jgi:hypothetical protein
MSDPTDERDEGLSRLLGDCQPDLGTELPNLLAKPGPERAAGDRESAPPAQESSPAAPPAQGAEESTPGSEPGPTVASELPEGAPQTVPPEQAPVNPEQTEVTEHEQEPAPQRKKRRSLALTVRVAFWLLVAIAGLALWFQAVRSRDLAVKTSKLLSGRTETIPAAKVRGQIAPGMSEEEVRAMLGRPHALNELEAGLSTIELWYYNCADGRVLITIRGGKVRGVKQL